MNPVQTDAFPGSVRVTVTLPATVLNNLDRVARRMGVSRSALLGELLAVPVEAMAEVVDALPAVGSTEDDAKRVRGKSAALIRRAVQEAQALIEPQPVPVPEPVRKRPRRQRVYPAPRALVRALGGRRVRAKPK